MENNNELYKEMVHELAMLCLDITDKTKDYRVLLSVFGDTKTAIFTLYDKKSNLDTPKAISSTYSMLENGKDVNYNAFITYLNSLLNN